VISLSHKPLPDNTRHSQQTYIHAAPIPQGGSRTRNPSRRAAADRRLRPHGHWDRLKSCCFDVIFGSIDKVFFLTTSDTRLILCCRASSSGKRPCNYQQFRAFVVSATGIVSIRQQKLQVSGKRNFTYQTREAVSIRQEKFYVSDKRRCNIRQQKFYVSDKRSCKYQTREILRIRQEKLYQTREILPIRQEKLYVSDKRNFTYQTREILRIRQEKL